MNRYKKVNGSWALQKISITLKKNYTLVELLLRLLISNESEKEEEVWFFVNIDSCPRIRKAENNRKVKEKRDGMRARERESARA